MLIWAGSSGVGSIAIQFAKYAGCWVATTAGNSEKASELSKLGADLVVNHKEQNVGQVIRDAGGVNLVIELVSTTLQASIDACLNDGRIVLIGNLGGQQATIDTQILRLKRINVIGGGQLRTSRENEERILQLVAGKLIHPIIAYIMPIENAAKAHRILDTGKSMSTPTYHTLIPMFEELRGERVLVRPYRESDAEALFEAMNESREHLRPWMPFADEHQTVEESRNWITHQMAQWLLRDDLMLSIWEQSTGRYLGSTGLHPHNWEIRYFEIGYWLRPSAEGFGYVTEAIRLLTDYALDSLKANRLEIRCDELNVRSAAVPKRLGYVLEGRLRNDVITTDGRLRTTLVFSLIPTDRQ